MSKLQIALDKLKRLNKEHIAEVGQLSYSVNGDKTNLLVTPVEARSVFDASGVKVLHQVYRFMFDREEFLKAKFSVNRGLILTFKGELYQSVQDNKGVGEDNAQLRGFITLSFIGIKS